jgi:hypothetical protein
MLGWPFSRWPVNRCDQELSLLTVTVTSYQPLAVRIGSISWERNLPAGTWYVWAGAWE